MRVSFLLTFDMAHVDARSDRVTWAVAPRLERAVAKGPAPALDGSAPLGRGALDAALQTRYAAARRSEDADVTIGLTATGARGGDLALLDPSAVCIATRHGEFSSRRGIALTRADPPTAPPAPIVRNRASGTGPRGTPRPGRGPRALHRLPGAVAATGARGMCHPSLEVTPGTPRGTDSCLTWVPAGVSGRPRAGAPLVPTAGGQHHRAGARGRDPPRLQCMRRGSAERRLVLQRLLPPPPRPGVSTRPSNGVFADADPPVGLGGIGHSVCA